MTTRRTLIVCALLLGACEGDPLVVSADRETPRWLDSDGDRIPDVDELGGTYGYESDPFDPDTDDDGLTDGDELLVTNTSPNLVDHDLDGLTDYEEYVIYGTLPREIDSDVDGIDDYREIFEYGTDPTSADTDGDGLRDGDEIDVHGSDPLDKDTDGDGLYDGQEVGHGTDPHRLDSDGDGLSDLEEVDFYKTDPTRTDSDLDGLDDGVEVLQTFTDPNDFDTDLDGLSDGAEIELGTNVFNFDTDGDGLSDGTEVNDAGSDPLIVDTDNDGLTDLLEYLLGTDPNSIDTDGDLLSDRAEVQESGTDPLQPDSDFDGIDDGDEIEVTRTDPLNPDTDGDLLLDGDEIDIYDTDPLDSDTDDDQLSDGLEILVFESSPLNPDTDGDDLLDGVEVDLYLTQPSIADTDGDGLDDGVEVNEVFTDPLLADTDDDELVDGDEWSVHGTDPFHPDSDGDGLTDGDEVHRFGTDPLDADTDGGGRTDAAEVGRGDDPTLAADDASCTYPTTDLPTTPMISEPEQAPAPIYARMHWSGIQVGSHFEDSSLGSAEFRLELLNATQQPLCDIVYDISGGQAPHIHETWATEGGGTFWQPVALDMTRSNTDCLAYLGQDLREWLAPIPWSVAMGPLDTLEQEVRDAVAFDGGNWAADWEPYVAGAFVQLEDGELLEVGYGFFYEATCDAVSGGAGALVPVAVPTDATPDHYLEVTGTRLFTIPDLLSIAAVVELDPYFEPVCLPDSVPTPVRGEGSCDEPFEIDMTQQLLGVPMTVQTGTGGVDEDLADSDCSDNARDVVFRVLLPPGAGFEASVEYPGAGPRPHMVLLEEGVCDAYAAGCSSVDATASCDVLRVEGRDLVGSVALITVSESTATGNDLALTLRSF